jgi:predicted nucleotidyltransferase
MSPDQLILKGRIETEDPSTLISELVLERLPHIFGSNWSEFRTWRARLAPRLGVDPCDIFFSGSAAVGFSLNPQKGLRRFDDDSDIDVAVVSAYHFDAAWRALRLVKRAKVSERDWESVLSHRRNYIFWGCIACDYVLNLLPFGKDWAVALNLMAQVAPTEDRMIKTRLYRDVNSLRDYLNMGINKLKASF